MQSSAKITKGVSQKCNKKLWVTAKWVIKATGWTKHEMRQARNSGLITWEFTDENGFQYDLYSVPPMFIKYDTRTTDLQHTLPGGAVGV